ncbi:MAG TPA: nuclear transport factor 2 family protein [Puia sp.]|nr:nuclear transport factor 2 family protein [Puia sp.]
MKSTKNACSPSGTTPTALRITSALCNITPASLRIRIALALPIFVCLAACMQVQAQPAPPPLRPQKVAEAWMQDLNSHDTMALANLYDDSARIFSPNWEGARTGKASIREIYRRYFTGTPDMQHRLTHLISTDTCLIIEYVSAGTFEHPEPGTPAYMQGKKYELQNCTRLDLRQGRIIRQVNYFDQVAFLRQVGFFEHLGN